MAESNGVHDQESHDKEQENIELDVGITNYSPAKRAGGWRGGIKSVFGGRGDSTFDGCTPIPYEDRTETKYFNIFTLWFSMSCNPLPYA
jgi:hypothetical protein